MLNQPRHAWFDRFSLAMLQYGYKSCQVYHIVFVKRSKAWVTMLNVNIDDIVAIGDDEIKIKGLKAYSGKEFEIEDLEELK